MTVRLREWTIRRYSTATGAVGSIAYRVLYAHPFILKVSWEGHREWLWTVHNETEPHIVGDTPPVAQGMASTLTEAKAAALEWIGACG